MFHQKIVACTTWSFCFFHFFIMPAMCNNIHFSQENLQSLSFRSKVRLKVIPQLTTTALPTSRSLCMKDCFEDLVGMHVLLFQMSGMWHLGNIRLQCFSCQPCMCVPTFKYSPPGSNVVTIPQMHETFLYNCMSCDHYSLLIRNCPQFIYTPFLWNSVALNCYFP